MTRSLLILALVAASAAGCVSSAGGVTGWREIRSPNFLLKTDLPSERAEAIAQDLESLRATIQGTFFPGLPAGSRPLLVVAFDSPYDFQRHAADDVLAFHTASPLGEEYIVMPATWARVQRHLIAHELTHHLAWQVFLRQPTWFSEGLAVYMESLAPVERGEPPTLGGLPSLRTPWLKHWLLVATVLDAPSLTEAGYASSWALVHFLANTERERLDRFMQRLAEGADPAVAWRTIFPEWDPAQPQGRAWLTRAVRTYLDGGTFSYGPAPTHPPVALAERPMPPAEVRELRFSLPLRDPNDKRLRFDLRWEIGAALAEDPDQVGALTALASLEPGQAEALAARAVAAHPEDVRSWLLAADSLTDDRKVEREQALRRAVETDPRNPRALVGLAALLLDTGRSGEALPIARRAAVTAPRFWMAFDVLAGVLEDLGRCEQALAARERALAVLDEREAGKLRARLEGRRASLATRCEATARAP